ncbi:biopolymer transporter ExbD [bacterium]|nr:biopolymer transporter ExbD [bacterium]
MSRARHYAAEDETEIDLTPMLDVVFIMLIFFIVTASFVKEFGLEISRPESTQDQPPSNDMQNVVVEITAGNDVMIDQRRVDIRSVRSVIQRKMAENPKAEVIINSAEEATARTYAAVADAARQAKEGTGVSLVVKEQ